MAPYSRCGSGKYFSSTFHHHGRISPLHCTPPYSSTAGVLRMRRKSFNFTFHRQGVHYVLNKLLFERIFGPGPLCLGNHLAGMLYKSRKIFFFHCTIRRCILLQISYLRTQFRHGSLLHVASYSRCGAGKSFSSAFHPRQRILF